MKAEYIRNINRNYVRVLLDGQTDYKRYQYCILDRGGIRYLLSCSCKNINGEKYLYYDISSTQNVRQRFADKKIGREWMNAFFWNVQKMRQELTRFLLDEKNIVWNPEYIFQDLEKNDFLYMYIPYSCCEEDCDKSFGKMLEFWVEKVDYDDALLSEFVYHAYEQFLSIGQSYLGEQIFEDFKKMEDKVAAVSARKEAEKVSGGEGTREITESGPDTPVSENDIEIESPTAARKKILPFWEGRKRKQEQKNLYREEVKRLMDGYAVCEESGYGEKSGVGEEVAVQTEEFGRTIYIEEKTEEVRGLYSEKGNLIVRLENFPFVIGKKKEECDYMLQDYSASRVHARFTEEKDGIYLEDLNSTNGTFKNGLRMQPYEKRKLESEDTLRFGKSTFIFK